MVRAFLPDCPSAATPPLPVRMQQFDTLCAAIRFTVPAAEVTMGSTYRAAHFRVPRIANKIALVGHGTSARRIFLRRVRNRRRCAIRRNTGPIRHSRVKALFAQPAFERPVRVDAVFVPPTAPIVVGALIDIIAQ